MSDSHHKKDVDSVRCVVVTVSDTRTDETDTSGRRIRELLAGAGHEVTASTIIPDEPHHIKLYVDRQVQAGSCEAILLSGGTGLAPRDQTYEVISEFVEKPFSGFGELFRRLSYEQIGPKAILSRAVAGVRKRVVVYAMPGSTPAVELAMTQIILPTIAHTVALVRNE